MQAHQLPQSLLDDNKPSSDTGRMFGHCDVQLVSREHAAHIGEVTLCFVVDVGGMIIIVIVVVGGGSCQGGDV